MGTYKKKYLHIAKDGFSELMHSSASGRIHIDLCLRLEKELYRLWVDIEGQKVTTTDFAITHEGLDDGIKQFHKKLLEFKSEYNMSPIADAFVMLEKKRLDDLRVRADKHAAQKPMRRTENNKAKIKNLINKMGLTKEDIIKLLEE